MNYADLSVEPAGAPSLSNDLDRELLHRVSAGDRAAFRDLYLRYHRRLARFLTRLTKRREDAEEIINDTLWIVWQRAGDFRNASRVSTWITGIAYRRALNMIRRATTHERAMRLEITEAEPTVSDDAQALEQRQLLDSGLAQLPLEQRLVLEFTYYPRSFVRGNCGDHGVPRQHRENPHVQCSAKTAIHSERRDPRCGESLWMTAPVTDAMMKRRGSCRGT